MRGKYRSAVHVYSDAQRVKVADQLSEMQAYFEALIITTPLLIDGFKSSPEHFQNYYQKDSSKLFCRTYIDPKLAKIRQQFGTYYDQSDGLS